MHSGCYFKFLVVYPRDVEASHLRDTRHLDARRVFYVIDRKLCRNSLLSRENYHLGVESRAAADEASFLLKFGTDYDKIEVYLGNFLHVSLDTSYHGG